MTKEAEIMFLNVSDIYKSYGGEEVLKGVSFSCRRGEFVSVIGPSGTGKTTLLKIIAGLEEPAKGELLIRSEKDLKLHPPILVFQDYMLFPYLNVYENVAFGLKARHLPAHTIRTKVKEILSLFQLERKTTDYPRQLSGGQQQRVALARALVLQPELLLLDEPYANLDRNLKLDTAKFLRSVQREFAITTICVTHDIEEALASSDKVGVLLDGRMADWGSPEKVYTRPAHPDSARFLGELNILPASLFSYLGIRDNKAFVYARPENITIQSTDFSPALVTEKRLLGTVYRYTINIQGHELVVNSFDGTHNLDDPVNPQIDRYFTSSPEELLQNHEVIPLESEGREYEKAKTLY